MHFTVEAIQSFNGCVGTMLGIESSSRSIDLPRLRQSGCKPGLSGTGLYGDGSYRHELLQPGCGNHVLAATVLVSIVKARLNQPYYTS
jgi:hypothetical protein